jgi:hemerythrin superfamily protein
MEDRQMAATRNQWISGRELAAFGIGAVAMFFAARLGSPAAGRALGSMRAMAGTDPFDALAADHRKVLALIDAMEATGSSARGRRMAMLFQLKRMLAAHALAEEDVIYPMLRDDAQRSEMAGRLYREHADMKIRLFELEHHAADDPAWMTELRGLRALIAEHARQEEDSEFPRLRQALGHERTSRLLSEVQREKALIV